MYSPMLITGSPMVFYCKDSDDRIIPFEFEFEDDKLYVGNEVWEATEDGGRMTANHSKANPSSRPTDLNSSDD